MALTPLHVRDVCYGGSWGGQTQCKYIDHIQRSDGKTVAVCTKHNAGAFAALEKKSSWYSRDKMQDNCSGYLMLMFKEQGYDK